MQGPAITEFGLCKTGILDRLGLSTACAAGELTLYEITAAASKAHAATPFAFVQSKVDAVQRTYNWALSAHELGELLGGITAGADPVWRALRNADPATLPPRGTAGARRTGGCGDPQWCFVSASQFYEDTNTIFRMYDKIPNHVHFLVQARGTSRAHLGVRISGASLSHLALHLAGVFAAQSSSHTYLGGPTMYDADPSSAFGRGKGGEALVHWLGRLPLGEGGGHNVSSRCFGRLQDGATAGAAGAGGGAGGDADDAGSDVRYCDRRLANKTFTPPARGPRSADHVELH